MLLSRPLLAAARVAPRRLALGARSVPVASSFAALAPRAAAPASSIRKLTFARPAFAQADRALAAKVEEEYAFEAEHFEDADGKPDFVKDFEKKGIFKLKDVRGEKEIVLSREHGNEKISVAFSIDSVNTDSMMEEEMPEDSANEPSYPVQVNIVVEKPGAGALQFLASAQDGAFFIDHVGFSKDAKLFSENNAQAEWVRNAKYDGPVFDQLDETLQGNFHEFLAARGFDEELANFIVDYIDYKEQVEYMGWLQNVSKFVSTN